jgi:hypothetical protein
MRPRRRRRRARAVIIIPQRKNRPRRNSSRRRSTIAPAPVVSVRERCFPTTSLNSPTPIRCSSLRLHRPTRRRRLHPRSSTGPPVPRPRDRQARCCASCTKPSCCNRQTKPLTPVRHRRQRCAFSRSYGRALAEDGAGLSGLRRVSPLNSRLASRVDCTLQRSSREGDKDVAMDGFRAGGGVRTPSNRA